MATNGIIVPAYVYPIGGNNHPDWIRLANAASHLQERLIVIANPACGPGDASNGTNVTDQDYLAAINAIRANGGRVIGYVHTCYHDPTSITAFGCPNDCPRDESDIITDIQNWELLYDVDGIFFDEVASDQAHVGYYEGLYQEVQNRWLGGTVVFNPGTLPHADYFNIGTNPGSNSVPIICIQESSPLGYNAYQLQSWLNDAQLKRSLLLIYNLTSTNFESIINRSIRDLFGWIYLCDSEWVTLPPYFEEIVSFIRSNPINQFCGSTVPGGTDWQQYERFNGTLDNHGIFVDIDTSNAGLTRPPRYFISLGGRTRHWTNLGSSSIYFPSANRFRVYLRHGSPVTPEQANEREWHINWKSCGI